jgi:hypothetical protein
LLECGSLYLVIVLYRLSPPKRKDSIHSLVHSRGGGDARGVSLVWSFFGAGVGERRGAEVDWNGHRLPQKKTQEIDGSSAQPPLYRIKIKKDNRVAAVGLFFFFFFFFPVRDKRAG